MNRKNFSVSLIASTALLTVLLLIPLPVSRTGSPPRAASATISLVERVQREEMQEPHLKVNEEPASPGEQRDPSPEPETADREGVFTAIAKTVGTTMPSLVRERGAPPVQEITSQISAPSPSVQPETPPEQTRAMIDGYYVLDALPSSPLIDRTLLASRIRYPALAKRQGKEGLVMLRLFISPTGLVEKVVVEEDPGYALAQAAVEAFLGFQGSPAVIDGKAVPVTLRYPVRFTLRS